MKKTKQKKSGSPPPKLHESAHIKKGAKSRAVLSSITETHPKT